MVLHHGILQRDRPDRKAKSSNPGETKKANEGKAWNCGELEWSESEGLGLYVTTSWDIDRVKVKFCCFGKL